MQIGSMLLADPHKKHAENFVQSARSFGRQAAAKIGLNKSINIKCKNMKSYDLAFAVDRTQLADGFPQCVLSREPE